MSAGQKLTPQDAESWGKTLRNGQLDVRVTPEQNTQSQPPDHRPNLANISGDIDVLIIGECA